MKSERCRIWLLQWRNGHKPRSPGFRMASCRCAAVVTIAAVCWLACSNKAPTKKENSAKREAVRSSNSPVTLRSSVARQDGRSEQSRGRGSHGGKRRSGASEEPQLTAFEKTFGTEASEEALGVVPVGDGEFVVIGTTRARSDSRAYSFDFICIDAHGHQSCEKSHGLPPNHKINGVAPGKDGHVLLAGETWSSDSGPDGWLIVADKEGDLLQEWTVGREAVTEMAYGVVQRPNGNYLLVGEREDTRPGNFGDLWVTELDEAGQVRWDLTHPMSGEQQGVDAVLLNDGSVLIAGRSNVPYDKAGRNFWLVKVDRDGSLMWDKVFDNKAVDHLERMALGPTGRLFMVGFTKPAEFHIPENAWVVATDLAGNLVWQSEMGTDRWDSANSVVPTPDGGCVFAGYRDGRTYDSPDQIWVVRLDNDGNEVWSKDFGGSSVENASGIVSVVDGWFLATGFTQSSGAGQNDIWVALVNVKR